MRLVGTWKTGIVVTVCACLQAHSLSIAGGELEMQNGSVSNCNINLYENTGAVFTVTGATTHVEVIYSEHINVKPAHWISLVIKGLLNENVTNKSDVAGE